jgi:hypothetical protein
LARWPPSAHTLRSVGNGSSKSVLGASYFTGSINAIHIAALSTSAGYEYSAYDHFGCSAVLLAAIGIYGLMAYSARIGFNKTVLMTVKTAVWVVIASAKAVTQANANPGFLRSILKLT